MPPRKRQRDLLPNYLKPEPDQSEDFDELNQQLNRLSSDLNVGSEAEVNDLGTRESQSNVKSDEEEFIGETIQSKWPRIETPMKLDDHPPSVDSFTLPRLQLFGDSTRRAKLPPRRKRSTSKEVSSYARIGFNTSTMPVRNVSTVDEASDKTSGRSDITKVDEMNNSPLDNKHVQGSTSKDIKPAKKEVIKVCSFDDLMSTTNEREILTKERPLNRDQKPRHRVDIVEPMKCNEGIKCEFNTDSMSRRKRNKRNVSLVEQFTEEEIKLHIMSLMKGSTQTRIRDLCHIKDEACQLCGDERLMFPPPPIYCSLCSRRIKDESFYYIPVEELTDDAQHQICNPCYNHCRSKFKLSGVTITRSKMLKKNNADNKISEEWVQCESCDKWQHQICGLYNMDKDVDQTAEYICPYCLLMERGESIYNRGFNDNTNLGAKDLPETILSHFIEQRLFKRLNEERCQTAKATGKSINDVLEPEDLTLRVVFSADKTSIVNKQFVDLLHKENYPSEFPYRSKVILLFQKVEGVDICIFAMFVQEFGSECSLPNQRSTYILYLDSVKYFKPERVTFAGEALRTFVYHEILIGYLEYCKLRGFTTGYIWACPPPKGEDYIMYSHPKTQQTPDTKKLRRWYVSMLEKAAEQRVVTNVTNLYDRFFVSKEKSTCNITAARLPYFEGSFWSYNAEVLIKEIERESNNELQKKVKSLSRRKLKSLSYKTTGSVDIDDAKNILLMQKLEALVLQNKEDFMVIDLHYSCTRCSKAILSGLRWFCEKCKNLQLCGSCYDAEQELPGEHIYTMNCKEKHQLSKVQVKNILSTTEDNDLIQENKMFETRQAFLSFSQMHNYNFDTLRRAKYSSMMILHHLHTSNKHHCSQNSSRLTCTNCKKDVSTTVYFPCLICPDYRACTGCYTKNSIIRHLHIFPTLPSANGTPPRTVMVLEILNAMPHALLCRHTATSTCSYPRCKEVKVLFNHSVQCIVKEKGACCKICSKLWKAIRIHAFHCRGRNCPVPRCSDMKEILVRKVP